MRDLLAREPALIVGVLVALANLAVGLGWLSDTEGQNVGALAESVVILLSAVLVRQKVYSPETHMKEIRVEYEAGHKAAKEGR